MKVFRNIFNASPVFNDNKTMFRCLFCLLFLPISLAGEERTFGSGALPELLAIYDVDNSGGLSEEELQAMRADRRNRQARLRNQWDRDGDGQLSAEEQSEAQVSIRENIEARRLRRFNDADQDEDGRLTLREFSQIKAVTDANSDNPGVTQRLFNHLDQDDDSAISSAEFLQRLDSLAPVPSDSVKPSPRATAAEAEAVKPSPRR